MDLIIFGAVTGSSAWFNGGKSLSSCFFKLDAGN